ncbi:hypothetical protein MBLNU457_g2953t1 [Dothideomycetes sp. NU457]
MSLPVLPVDPIQDDAVSEYDSIITIKFVPKSDDSDASETFKVHRGLITQYSGYFRTALEKDNFKEGKTGTVELELEDLKPFKMFLAWLYQRSMLRGACSEPTEPCIKLVKDTGKDDDGNAADLMSRYVYAWIFGEMRQAPEFQDWVMLRLVTVANQIGFWINKDAVQHAYDNTLLGSPLRKYLVDVLVPNALPRVGFFQENEDLYKDYPKSFTEDLLVLLLTRTGGTGKWTYDPASYMRTVDK